MPSSPVSPVPTYGRLITHDVDEHAAAISCWDARLEQLCPGRFEGEVEFIATTRLTAYRESWSRELFVRAALPQAGIAFGIFEPPRRADRFWGQELPSHAMPFVAAGDEVHLKSEQHRPHWVMIVDQAAFAEYLERVHQTPLHRLTCDTRHLPARTSRLKRQLQYLISCCRSGRIRLADRAVARRIEEEVMSGLAEAILPTDHCPCYQHNRSRYAVVKQAIEYLNAKHNPHCSVAALCLELDVSQRTLEYAFRDVVGVTPVRYLKLRRLNLAYRALRAGDPQTDSVTRIAAHCGILELGRFAVEFRRLFGFTPSETLKRAPIGAGLLRVPAVFGATLSNPSTASRPSWQS